VPIDIQTLNCLSTKGVDFCVQIPNECGIMTYIATPEDLVMLESDPTALYAKVHGVTKSEFRDWQDDGCMAFCAATTRARKRCRNQVKGGYQVSAKR
jgi:hypothetical protein